MSPRREPSALCLLPEDTHTIDITEFFHTKETQHQLQQPLNSSVHTSLSDIPTTTIDSTTKHLNKSFLDMTQFFSQANLLASVPLSGQANLPEGAHVIDDPWSAAVNEVIWQKTAAEFVVDSTDCFLISESAALVHPGRVLDFGE
ncbi:unnamed protein product [Protopolystoma xenopodis]|uniref:Uncharacterized protein n=1 Tax=Protopolystoma xenopodis TaxID=117903 RepID=A0A3S5AIS5_9PLAT|nr:unnamed protein product [Protopolystoma xenopodis]